MGPLGGMIMGAMAAPAGAGLGATLAAGAKGALASNPIGAALLGAGSGGLPGALSGAAHSIQNPLMSAALTAAPNAFTPSAASGAADTSVPKVATINSTPRQSFPGAADPKALWGDLRGQGFNDAQSAALLGNMKQESEFRPGAVNPGEGAQGLIQWRGARLANLQSFAQSQGKPYTDPSVQVAFLKHEMQTTESGPGQKFLAATTVPEANAALKGYIRYGSPPDKGGINTRLANASGYYQQFTGMPVTAGVNAPTPATGTAPVAQNVQADPAIERVQQLSQALKDQHAAGVNQPVAAPSGAPAVQGGNIAGQRQEALLSPALQLLAKLKQQAQASTVPAVGGKSPVTI